MPEAEPESFRRSHYETHQIYESTNGEDAIPCLKLTHHWVNKKTACFLTSGPNFVSFACFAVTSDCMIPAEDAPGWAPESRAHAKRAPVRAGGCRRPVTAESARQGLSAARQRVGLPRRPTARRRFERASRLAAGGISQTYPLATTPLMRNVTACSPTGVSGNLTARPSADWAHSSRSP